ncbi:MAG: hypothetical protein ACK46N_07750, partial [Dolichospermum sp.]
TAIISLSSLNPDELTRLQLVPREYGFITKNVPLTTTAELINDLQGVLTGNAGEMLQTALWNGGFYLWRSGISPNMQAGIDKAATLISSGVVKAKLDEISTVMSDSEAWR